MGECAGSRNADRRHGAGRELDAALRAAEGEGMTLAVVDARPMPPRRPAR